MASFFRFLVLCVLAYSAAVFSSACRGRSEEPAQSVLGPAAAKAPVRALMAGIIDPAADVVWQSVGTTVSTTGTDARVPRTDEEWANVRLNARMLIEASELLQTPGRPIAGQGEKSVAPGIELEPEEILVNVNKDREGWNRLARAFHDASVNVLQAIDAKDAEKVFELGTDLDATCEKCHTTFWYPNQPLPPGYVQ